MSKTQTYQDKVIWVIGASSGIGAALAQELASRGAVLALSARRKDALEKLKDSLGGKKHKVFALDITDAELVTRTAGAIRAAFGRIDSVIFLAANYTPMKLTTLNLAVTKQIIDVNLTGAFHVVHAVLPILQDQSQGQIALCGSIAGYIGLPGGQPYSATKAAIINLAESLRGELPERIDVKLINPGFVRTALTDKNNFKMPMIIETESAAKAIADGLCEKRFEIHFPKRFTCALKVLKILPYSIKLAIARKVS
jgi:short-subunit dehydrogenase